MLCISNIVRKNIINLEPYSSARDEFFGQAEAFLDANENSLGGTLYSQAYHRYPDPLQHKLKEVVASIKQITTEQLFIGNGSDEAIDLLYRCFCEPRVDNVIICPPTYGMYEVSAKIQDVDIKKVNLLPSFQLDLDGIAQAIDEHTKLIWICAPNNPTGNYFFKEDIEIIIHNFNGLVIIDEAYINFSRHRSFISLLSLYPNVVVLQTLSKAWGLASLRIGLMIASSDIIRVINKVKAPYNISGHTQELVLSLLSKLDEVNECIKTIVALREELIQSLSSVSIVEKVYSSETNFILIKTQHAHAVYHYLKTKGVIIRDRSKQPLCEGCLRITVGTKEENKLLMHHLQSFTL